MAHSGAGPAIDQTSDGSRHLITPSRPPRCACNPNGRIALGAQTLGRSCQFIAAQAQGQTGKLRAVVPNDLGHLRAAHVVTCDGNLRALNGDLIGMRAHCRKHFTLQVTTARLRVLSELDAASCSNSALNPARALVVVHAVASKPATAPPRPPGFPRPLSAPRRLLPFSPLGQWASADPLMVLGAAGLALLRP